MASGAEPRIAFGRPVVGREEREAVADVMLSPQLVHGPKSADFEDKFASFLGDNVYATAVSSCTAGLHLAYLHLGIGPGDEVVLPAQTHVATAHTVEVTGARPVFVDCDITGNIDQAQAINALSDRTKAVCVVHYPGLPIDTQLLRQETQRRGIALIEDCALALGGKVRDVACGLLGDISCFSFYPIKHITTGEGGMVVSTSKTVIDSIANLKAFGYDRSLGSRRTPGVYDVQSLGLNYRMSEISAAIGIAQLDRLEGFLKQREKNAQVLRMALEGRAGFSLLPPADGVNTHANYCVIAVLDEDTPGSRNKVITAMQREGIGSSVYYPVPIPLSKYYRGRYGYRDEQFPIAARISRSSVALPVGPHLRETDMQILAECFVRVVGEVHG